MGEDLDLARGQAAGMRVLLRRQGVGALLGQPQALTDQAQPPGRLRKQLQILARERPMLARDGQGPVRRVVPMLAVRGPCLLHEALTFVPAVPHPLT